jgi:TetR/AcrR family transcriptional repressor of nem operon
MSKAENTRQFIIERSAPIFNRKGYAGTSLTDLIEATGLTKGSIYGNFENKDAVAVAVYEYNIKALRKRIAAFVDKPVSATEKLIAFTEYYRTNYKALQERGGCPIQNASIEADDNLSFLKKHVQQSIRNWVRDIAHIIEEGQKKGEFKKNIDATEYAFTIISVLEGGIMLFKIMNDQKALYAALDRIIRIVQTEIKK